MKQSTLSLTLTFHRQQGSILEHHRKFYNESISQKITDPGIIEKSYWLKKLYIYKKKVLLLTFKKRILLTFWNYLQLIIP